MIISIQWQVFILNKLAASCIKIIYIISFALCFCIPNSYADAWQINGNVGLTTNSVYKGLSYTGDQITPRASLYLAHQSGFFLGNWVTQHDLGGLINNSESRDVELEFNLGYFKQLTNLWSFSLSHAWLEFGSTRQTTDYDYREYRLASHYSDWLSLSVNYTDGVWNTNNKLTTTTITARHALPFGILSEGELGWLDFESGGNPVDFPFLRLSIGKSIHQNWTTALEYNYSDTRASTFLNSARVGNNISAILTYHFRLK